METLSEIHDGEEFCTFSANALEHVLCVRERSKFGFSESIPAAVVDTHAPLLWISMRFECQTHLGIGSCVRGFDDVVAS